MGNRMVRRLTLAATLAALGSIVKIFFQITTLADFRFSLYEIPLIIAGFVLGPFLGLAAGLSADWVYATVFGYGPNLMTVTSMMWGFLAGVMLYKRKLTTLRLSMFMVLASLLALGINSVQLAMWFGWLSVLGNLPIRIGIMIVSIPIQVYLVRLVVNRVVLETDIGRWAVVYEPANEKS